MDYKYSIEVARRIYTSIKSDQEAISVCKNNIESFLTEKGEDYHIEYSSEGLLSNIIFCSTYHKITLQSIYDKPTQIILSSYEGYPRELVSQAYREKALFGLPVFTITIIEDIPLAMIGLMSRETYYSLDDSGQQDLFRKMDMLDSIIEKYGGNSNW